MASSLNQVAADSQVVAVDPTSGCQPGGDQDGRQPEQHLILQGLLVQTRNCNDTLQLLKGAEEDRHTLRESLESCESAFKDLQVFGKPHLKNTEADRPTKPTPVTSRILTMTPAHFLSTPHRLWCILSLPLGEACEGDRAASGSHGSCGAADSQVEGAGWAAEGEGGAGGLNLEKDIINKLFKKCVTG